MTRLLRHLFDFVFIETVGVGQSEIEVGQLADVTLLVMQPLAGDHVQFMKAGVMEIPDAFVINKCDEEKLARRSHHELRSALDLARVGAKAGEHRIFQTSALSGRGIDDVVAYLREARRVPPGGQRRRERHYLRKTVMEQYGRFGLAVLDALGIDTDTGALFEDLEARALAAIAARVTDPAR